MVQGVARLVSVIVGLLLVAAVVGCGNSAPAATPAPQSIATTTAVVGGTPARPAERVQVGYSAPDFTVKSPDGTPITVSAHRGTAVILNFWATWCGPCKLEIPDLVSIQDEYKDRLTIIGIDVREDKDTVSDYIAAHHMTYPVGIDGTGILGNRFNVHSYPRSFFLNRDGIITYIAFGALDYDQIKTHVEEALAT